MDGFAFKVIGSLEKPLVLVLAGCEYVDHRDNVIALGLSGACGFVTNWGVDDV